jgi:type II secretory pathway pseudopilin PulG
MNFKLKLLQHLLRDESAGLTIIEGLLAIIVVTILIMAIGPVLAFAAATRIQARRVELASQAATAYLDGVRSGTVAAPPIAAVGSLPPPPPAPDRPPNYADELSKISAPSANSLTCVANQYCTAPAPTAQFSLYCVDRDGDSQCTAKNPKDFVIQAMGVQRVQATPIALNTDRASLGYRLSIRVYRADSFGTGLTLLKSRDNKPGSKAATLAGGSGNRVAPVVEMTTEIPAS